MKHDNNCTLPLNITIFLLSLHVNSYIFFSLIGQLIPCISCAFIDWVAEFQPLTLTAKLQISNRKKNFMLCQFRHYMKCSIWFVFPCKRWISQKEGNYVFQYMILYVFCFSFFVFRFIIAVISMFQESHKSIWQMETYLLTRVWKLRKCIAYISPEQ